MSHAAAAAAAGMPMQEVDREDHKPMLLWMMNNWHIIEPLIKSTTAKLNPKVEVLLLDCRTKRGTHVSTLDPHTVFADSKIVETTALRSTISAHPYLYNDKWSAQFGKTMKTHIKKMNGTLGTCFLIAIGDSTEHGPEEEGALPDFTMKIAPYYMHDLHVIQEASIKQLQQQQEAARAQALKEMELARKRAEIVARVEAAKREQAAREVEERVVEVPSGGGGSRGSAAAGGPAAGGAGPGGSIDVSTPLSLSPLNID